LTKADKFGKEQEQLKMKYKKGAKYSFLGGGIIGVLLCLILGI